MGRPVKAHEAQMHLDDLEAAPETLPWLSCPPIFPSAALSPGSAALSRHPRHRRQYTGARARYTAQKLRLAAPRPDPPAPAQPERLTAWKLRYTTATPAVYRGQVWSFFHLCSFRI
jgi:hypothetical protein